MVALSNPTRSATSSMDMRRRPFSTSSSMAASKMACPASGLRGRPGRAGNRPSGRSASSTAGTGIGAPFLRLSYRNGSYRIIMRRDARPDGDHHWSCPGAPAGLNRQPGPGRALARPEEAGYGRPALALILIAAFMVVLDFSIVNVALPSIERELGFGASSVQWVVTGYAITFGGFLVLGGRAADLFGRRRMFVAGLLAFSAASLAGGLAHDAALLVASRAVQGAGAALVAPAALSLITTGFPQGPRRTAALGAYGATSSLGFVAGQVLGGVLVELFSWRAVFLVNVPLGLLAAALAPRLLRPPAPEPRPAGLPASRRLDTRGAVLITLAVDRKSTR